MNLTKNKKKSKKITKVKESSAEKAKVRAEGKEDIEKEKILKK